jgi:hypothetical protein
MRSFVCRLLARLGYEVHKIQTKNDLAIYYALFNCDDVVNRRFYNVGAGLFRHPVWTNVDYYSNWYQGNPIDMNFDLFELKPLPIESKSASIVYSSHTIEHITDEAAQNLFDEAYRILKKRHNTADHA